MSKFSHTVGAAKRLSFAVLLVAVSGCVEMVSVTSSGEFPSWQLEVLTTLGSAGLGSEPLPDEFGGIGGVVPDAEGNVWIADALNDEIKVFGPDGSFVRRFGRTGEGPGEFEGIQDLAWMGDVLLVLDGPLGRVGEVSREGEWLGSRQIPGRISGPDVRFFPVNDTLVYQLTVGQKWIVHGPSGILREQPMLSIESEAEYESVICNTSDGSLHWFPVPFGARSILRKPDAFGGEYTVSSWDYRIVQLGESGDTTRVIERVIDPVPITDAEWEAETEDWTTFKNERDDASCRPRELERPPAKAAITNILGDTDGWLWVEVPVPGGTEWNAFDLEGRLQGSLPSFDYETRNQPSFHKGFVAWANLDSDGVPKVHLARIVR